jgi:hypothetical protein
MDRPAGDELVFIQCVKAITAHLNRDVPKEIASERMSVSVDTLEEGTARLVSNHQKEGG